MKSARRRAREVALQALYAWQLAGGGSGHDLRKGSPVGIGYFFLDPFFELQ